LLGARLKVGVGRTKFHQDYVLHDENDPYVPGTDSRVHRVRPVALGERAMGFFEDELNTLIEELRDWRNANPVAQDEERRRLTFASPSPASCNPAKRDHGSGQFKARSGRASKSKELRAT
jgi:hypothetical protein